MQILGIPSSVSYESTKTEVNYSRVVLGCHDAIY